MTEVVHRLPGIRAEGQGAVAAAATSRIQFHPQQARCVQAETERAFGESRLQAQDKALRPVAGLGLRCTRLPIVAQLIEVAQVEVGAAVFEKFRPGGEREQRGGERGVAQDAGLECLEHCSFLDCYFCRSGWYFGMTRLESHPIGSRAVRGGDPKP
ncbi:hypothetical protein D3C76_1388520 [compost metagenome]